MPFPPTSFTACVYKRAASDHEAFACHCCSGHRHQFCFIDGLVDSSLVREVPLRQSALRVCLCAAKKIEKVPRASTQLRMIGLPSGPWGFTPNPIMWQCPEASRKPSAAVLCHTFFLLLLSSHIGDCAVLLTARFVGSDAGWNTLTCCCLHLIRNLVFKRCGYFLLSLSCSLSLFFFIIFLMGKDKVGDWLKYVVVN